MSRPPLAPPRLLAGDVDLLERRARELAAGVAEDGEEGRLERVVAFRLGDRPCAVDAGAVERALVRIASVLPVPSADGSERAIIWVEERPIPVVDLAGAVGGAERAAALLPGLPAVVLETPEGPVAVAVDGPIELREERLVGAAPLAREEAAGPRPRLAGRLGDGTSVLDASWMVAWARRSARP
jgi:chemotaxis signal transduction protein